MAVMTFMDINEERELIKQAQKDPLAFGRLYDFYYPKIFGYVLRRTADFQIAQDITSETFFKALKNLWQFRFRSIPFSAWLYRIATNETTNYFRKHKYTFSIENENIPELIALHNPKEEFIEAQEQFRRHRAFLKIQHQITTLPVAYQEVITLRFFEKKQINEIAQILGRKEGTIKSILHRGLEKLRELMK